MTSAASCLRANVAVSCCTLVVITLSSKLPLDPLGFALASTLAVVALAASFLFFLDEERAEDGLWLLFFDPVLQSLLLLVLLALPLFLAGSLFLIFFCFCLDAFPLEVLLRRRHALKKSVHSWVVPWNTPNNGMH